MLIKHEKVQLVDCTWTAELFIDLIKGTSNYGGATLKKAKERKKVEGVFLLGSFVAEDCSPTGKLPQVDFMLGSYMEDIGITAKEFEAACTQGKSITGKFHQQLFEQVSPFHCLLSYHPHTLNAGLGCGWLWDFQEDDDPEEHRPADGGLGIVTAEVRTQSYSNVLPPQNPFFLLISRYGVLPESLQPSKGSPTASVEGEDKVMQEVTRLVQN